MEITGENVFLYKIYFLFVTTYNENIRNYDLLFISIIEFAKEVVLKVKVLSI